MDRFGRDDAALFVRCVRPAARGGGGEAPSRIREEGGVLTAEYGGSSGDAGYQPAGAGATGIQPRNTCRNGENALHALRESLHGLPSWRQRDRSRRDCANRRGGYVQLRDGTAVTEGDAVFLGVRPVRWLYDRANGLLICCQALFGGMNREEAAAYLEGCFPGGPAEESCRGGSGTRCAVSGSEHDELSLIRAYVEANIPVFLHGLSGDGKSDRVRQIDPQALDIELVNENPETINGRAIYNEARDEIIDIKPVWLVKLERLCEDGELHILFFDELTNATKQTQSVIFKIVLERFVNNRWALPPNARIVAAGNDRSESSAAHDLAEPLFGRFAHIYIRTTVENWMPWAVRSRINPYVMEFLANNDLYLRTPFTGTEGNADPRRWEMVSKALDSSGNDFSLLAPIVGRDAAEAFIRFFGPSGDGTRSESTRTRSLPASAWPGNISWPSSACSVRGDARKKEGRALVARLGKEYLAGTIISFRAANPHSPPPRVEQ